MLNRTVSQAAKAFVSFVRAYSKHEAAYIFRLKDLDLLGLARAFGLLRLPRMPELSDRRAGPWDDARIDVSTRSPTYHSPLNEQELTGPVLRPRISVLL